MGPEKPVELDGKALPDLRTEWGQQAVREVYADESLRTGGAGAYLGHRGSKIIASDGALVVTDAEPKLSDKSLRHYETHYRYKGGPYRIEITNPEQLKSRIKLAEVIAEDGSKVLAIDASVAAGFGSFVQAGPRAQVEAYEGSIVRAQDGSRVSARERSRVVAENGAIVTAFGGSRVVASEGSMIYAMPGAEVIAKSGSHVRLMEPGDNFEYEPVKLTTEKGSKISVSDPFLTLDANLEGDVTFSGSKGEWQEFRSRNPKLKMAEPNFNSMADIINGTENTWKDSGMLGGPDEKLRPHRIPRPPASADPPLKPTRSFADQVLDVAPKPEIEKR